MRKALFLITALTISQQMLAQIFTSPNKWFSCELPSSWTEYDSEEEGTYAFFNKSMNWTGNLRITSIKAEKEEGNLGAALREMQLKKYPGSQILTMGKHQVVSYITETTQDNTPLIIYHWVTGEKKIAIICTFTIEKKDSDTQEMKNELKIVESIISSIKFLQ